VAIEESSTSAIVEGVEVSLDRAFSNLLDNAIAAAPAGSAVRIGSGVLDGWAWLGVEDRGPGLPDEPEGGRLGFGLSIVSQIADAHGGALDSHPTEGGGATMLIWLPTADSRPTSMSIEHPDIIPFTNT
jgi:signal transduction histidine kinase